MMRSSRTWQIFVFPLLGFSFGCMAIPAVLIMLSLLTFKQVIAEPLAGLIMLAAVVMTGLLTAGGYYLAVRNNRPDRPPMSDEQLSTVIEMMAKVSGKSEDFPVN